MSVDICIIISSVVSFIIFFVIQIALFRIRVSNKSVYWMLRFLLISWICGLVFGYLFLTYFIDKSSIPSGVTAFLIISLFAVISTLAIAVYVFGVFSMTYASIHLDILCQVAGFGRKGVTTTKIFQLFNKNTIISGRIKRLVDCGELVFSSGKYRLAKNQSPLLLREKLSIIISKLFP